MTGEASVGKAVPPEDTVRKVTGTALYTFDWELPGTLHAKLVTSTAPHAKIENISHDRAMQVPGVAVFLSGWDMRFWVGMYAGYRDLLAVE